jgi:hypothetical protein
MRTSFIFVPLFVSMIRIIIQFKINVFRTAPYPVDPADPVLLSVSPILSLHPRHFLAAMRPVMTAVGPPAGL